MDLSINRSFHEEYTGAMPSIRFHGNSLADLDEMELDDIDFLDEDPHRQRADMTTNFDARARSADLQAQRRSDRRKNAVRGARRTSERR